MAANDFDVAGGRLPCPVDMSILDLAIFMRVHRAGRVASAGEISTTIARWFDCDLDPRDVEQALPRMIESGWLSRRGDVIRPTLAGRQHGRLHLCGLVRMMDQGTKMLDVARIMSVLHLAMIELHGDYEEGDDDEG